MESKLSWGIIGTGAIAKTVASAIVQSQTGQLTAVASRSRESADSFGQEFDIGSSQRYDSYAALLQDEKIQAVYVATPHPWHAEWAIKAAAADKHLLVEKPIAVTHHEARAIFDSAKSNRIFLMEAFMYRCHPQTSRLVELVKQNAIGQVRLIHATFSFRSEFNPRHRLYDKTLGGGGILDIGCYPVSMVRLIAGAALGKDFADPLELKALGHLESSGVDGYSSAVLKFPQDVLAQISSGISLTQENIVRIYGTHGNILVNNPWMANRVSPETSKLIVQRSDQTEPTVVDIAPISTSFVYEIDVVGRAILAGKTEASSPAMTWADSMGNMRTLDLWRHQIGLSYESEKGNFS